MPHLNDGAARSLQDIGVDLDKLAAWEQTDEGKAATQRFAEMCERGEIISRPAWATDVEIPVQIADFANPTSRNERICEKDYRLLP